VPGADFVVVRREGNADREPVAAQQPAAGAVPGAAPERRRVGLPAERGLRPWPGPDGQRDPARGKRIDGTWRLRGTGDRDVQAAAVRLWRGRRDPRITAGQLPGRHDEFPLGERGRPERHRYADVRGEVADRLRYRAVPVHAQFTVLRRGYD